MSESGQWIEDENGKLDWHPDKPGHTPGPWTYCKNGKYGSTWSVNTPQSGKCVATNIHTKQDAALISAAPDLLGACKAALDMIGRDPASDMTVKIVLQIQAAIRKAQGQ
jgi:hypothetical protein